MNHLQWQWAGHSARSTDGVKNFSRSVHGLEDTMSVDFQDGEMTWLASQERDGREWRRTGQFGKPRGRPMSAEVVTSFSHLLVAF